VQHDGLDVGDDPVEERVLLLGIHARGPAPEEVVAADAQVDEHGVRVGGEVVANAL
jgi:hypothetical protein